ncbi:MAG: hypothetical protein UU78_C0062G0004 [Candidatus Roizmanbacteria bacterium GW2011_GWC2_41_7]|uniref:Uncharacterized protein n=1 Tax=Candidatus Roizmanbacteria bacterium GW2011_GWC2_41_7 TaxID=1618487 RepID=A0A0G0X614_9BACT|nr:MAG: hypothetical protein UT26_C0020G0004 [Microgenomates group bacterium GW2011_GWC1_39_12]KKS20499.1 MAG: hypothetical protein UU78_C0062G0004 [Candidatus Roizmanbacteria bacterium GW2011_GWC2_41_7]
MNKAELVKIVHYIIKQGISTIKSNTDEQNSIIDYVAIFSREEKEFTDLIRVIETLGKEIDKETAKTGRTFLLDTPWKTVAGKLSLIKIRRPDPTRPQRGDPDFKIQDYQRFKDKYLKSSGNFTLLLRKDYEMIEIKGIDVLVYIPSKTLSERLQKT